MSAPYRHAHRFGTVRAGSGSCELPGRLFTGGCASLQAYLTANPADNRRLDRDGNGNARDAILLLPEPPQTERLLELQVLLRFSRSLGQNRQR